MKNRITRIVSLMSLLMLPACVFAAGDFNKPRTSDLNRVDYAASIRENDAELAKMLDGSTALNIPIGAKRWNASTNKWEKWTGAAWVDMATNNTYGINVSGSANYATSAGSAASSTNSTNSTNATYCTYLNNQLGSYYQAAATAITTGNIASQSVNYANSAGSAATASSAGSANSVPWSGVTGKPSFNPVAWGMVQADGTITTGSGNFTVTRENTGRYRLNYSLGLTTYPTITVTPAITSGYVTVCGVDKNFGCGQTACWVMCMTPYYESLKDMLFYFTLNGI